METPDLSRPFCYYVCPTNVDAEGNYVPSIVVEGRPGHWPLSYNWGKSLEMAEKAAESKNAEMGLSKEDAWKIITSSMGASRELTHAKRCRLKNVVTHAGSQVPEVRDTVARRLTR